MPVTRKLIVSCLVISVFSLIFLPSTLHADSLEVKDTVPVEGAGDNLLFTVSLGGFNSLTMGFDTNEVVVHEVGRNAVLTHVQTLPGGPEPRQVAIARNGDYAVVVNSSSDELNVHRINNNGTLEPVGTTPSGGDDPFDVAEAHDDIVVVANRDSNNIGTFHIDRRGRLHPLDVALTGLGPHVVSVTRRGLVAVANSSSNDVSVYEISRRGAINTIQQSLPTGTQPRSIAFANDAMFVAAISSQPTVIEDEIQTFDVQRIGGEATVTPTGSIPCGFFLTDVAVVGKWLFAATVNGNIRDEIRAYKRNGTELTLEAALELPNPTPSFKQLTAEKVPGPVKHLLLVTEYQDDVLNSIEHRKD